jgi:glycosyltransferase involved in cell wall biosynthesis
MKVMLFGTEAIVHCRRYIHLLQLAECDVTFVEQRRIQPLCVPNVKYRHYPRRYSRFEKRLGTRTTYYLHKQGLRMLWRRVKPDICHVQWVDDHLWHSARAGLRPLVATAWGSDLNLAAKASADDPARQRLAGALGQLDLLIVDSDDMVATAELLAGKSLRTTLLPIGIDTDKFRPGLHQQRREWRQTLQIDFAATVFLSARQLGANYRQIEIIRAFAALDQDIKKNCYLIVRTFGHSNGVSLPELHELAEMLKVSDRIRWVEEIEYTQLPGLYAASDMAINFPIMDAFPVTFLECFSCGLPVLTNWLPSYESNGIFPYLSCAEEDSVVGLKTRMEGAVKMLDQLQVRAVTARDHVVHNYHEHRIAGALRRIYESLLDRPNG